MEDEEKGKEVDDEDTVSDEEEVKLEEEIKNDKVVAASSTKGETVLPKNFLEGIDFEEPFYTSSDEGRKVTKEHGTRKFDCLFYEKVSFTALGAKVKTTHDRERFGEVTCGLWPHCDRILCGGEPIGKVTNMSPPFHRFFEKTAWVCWPHADWSLRGLSRQSKQEFKEELVLEEGRRCTDMVVVPRGSKVPLKELS